MADKILQDFIIPAAYGKAFLVNKGQVMKIVAIEGSQVCDIAFFNAMITKRPMMRPTRICITADWELEAIDI